MKLISSYPRSGSAKLKFILCNLLYPEIDHDFTTMSRYIPSIDNPETRANGEGCEFMCTHSHIDSDIYLYRHVGDCLISEYWFKQKFYPSNESLERFIIKSNYGELWRKSVEAGRSAKIKIDYSDLDNPISFEELCVWSEYEDIETAIKKSSFEHMRSVENEKGFYYLPEGDNDIPYMREGTSGQWKDLPKELIKKIHAENEGELEYLNLSYYDDIKGEYIQGIREPRPSDG